MASLRIISERSVPRTPDDGAIQTTLNEISPILPSFVLKESTTQTSTKTQPCKYTRWNPWKQDVFLCLLILSTGNMEFSVGIEIYIVYRCIRLWYVIYMHIYIYITEIIEISEYYPEVLRRTKISQENHSHLWGHFSVNFPCHLFFSSPWATSNSSLLT